MSRVGARWSERGRLGAVVLGASWLGASLLGACCLSGCAGAVESTVIVRPPKPLGVQIAEPQSADQACASGSPGCSDAPADADGDGIVGAADKCPDVAETVNQYQDGDGCADTVPEVFVRDDGMVVVKEPITFGFGGVIDKSAETTLDAIAAALKTAKAEETIVAVHVYGRGSSSEHQSESNKRADRVVKALGERGIDEAQLVAVGLGSQCPPAAPGDGRQHATVEVRVVKKAGSTTKMSRGCPSG